MRRALVVAWCGLAAVVWNVVFDGYITRGARDYLARRTAFEAGSGQEPAMDVVMAAARHDGALAATTWAVLVLGLGWMFFRVRRAVARSGPPGAPEGRSR